MVGGTGVFRLGFCGTVRSNCVVPVGRCDIELVRMRIGNNGQTSEGIGEFLVGTMAQNAIGEGIANGSVIVVWFAVGQGDRNHGVGDASLLLAALGMGGIVKMSCKTPSDRIGGARILKQ